MGIARRIAPHGAQAETFGRVIAGRLDPAIIEHDHFGPAAFEEQLAVVGPGECVAQDAERGIAVQQGVKGTEGGVGHGGFLGQVQRSHRGKWARTPEAGGRIGVPETLGKPKTSLSRTRISGGGAFYGADDACRTRG